MSYQDVKKAAAEFSSREDDMNRTLTGDLQAVTTELGKRGWPPGSVTHDDARRKIGSRDGVVRFALVIGSYTTNIEFKVRVNPANVQWTHGRADTMDPDVVADIIEAAATEELADRRD